MKRIAITCELKERELLFLTILKKKLEEKGYDVKLIDARILCGLKLIKFKPDIVIVNGLRGDRNLFKQILVPKRLFNSKIISLYSEQVGKQGGLYETYNNNRILNSIDAHVVWGPLFAEGLEKLGVERKYIHITGSFSLDIPKYLLNNDILRERLSKKYHLDSQKEWIIIADNMIRKGAQIERYEQRRAEFNELIKKISVETNNSEIIFRPHP